MDIEFIGWRDFLQLDIGGKADPYIEASLIGADGKALKNESYCTEVAPDHKWENEWFPFGCRYDLLNPLQPTLLLQVFSKKSKADLGNLLI